MPNYQTHDSIGSALAITGVVVSYSMNILLPEDSIIFGLAIFLGTYYLSPDLDTDSRIYRRWGWLRWLWYPYKQLIAHRSIWSHSGPLSATLRLMYIGWIPIVISMFYMEYIYWPAILLIWLGVILADSIHVIADIVSSAVKRIM